MSQQLHFYFDFYSPYAYFSSREIDAIGEKHGREVVWHPILLGAVFKHTGATPLLNIPLVGEYAMRDLQRAARKQDILFVLPENFPHAAIAASRAYFWIADEDPVTAKKFALAVFNKGFVEGANMSDAEMVLGLAESLGIDRDALEAALATDALKNRLKLEVQEAMDQGVFGSPYFIVDGEPFWGNDRLAELDDWLETGGW